mgnify:FL=1|tara:strand:- start:883 stop:1452 length:570 start_codon:yes stop_codon:yes gene_type:complete
MENSNINDIITPSLSNNNLFTDSPSISKPTIQPLTKSPWFYIKIVFIVLFLALMGLNIFTYLSEGTDVFGKYLGISLLRGAEGTKDVISTTKKGGDIALDVVAGSTRQIIDIPERQIRNKLNKKQQYNRSVGKNGVKSTNTDMISNNSSYCYIGSENGNRRCVEASKDDVCESDKVFPTMDLCINPYLR